MAGAGQNDPCTAAMPANATSGGADCTAEGIAEGLQAVLENPRAQEAAMALTMARLGKGGEAPGLRAARAVLEAM